MSHTQVKTVMPRIVDRPVSSEDATLLVRCVAVAVAIMTFAWSYWPTIAELYRVWQSNPDYSAGQLVFLIALYVVWSRRRVLKSIPMSTCWWGLGIVLFSQFLRLAAVALGYGSIEQYSLIMAIAGSVLLIFGWAVTRKLAWVLVFLLLMVPFPRRVHSLLALPMQQFATSSAVFCLELLGYLVARQGNVLTLGENSSISVAEACSGLRMLTAFITVGATLAFILPRPKWQKLVLVLATLPVAVIVNTLRITATAMVSHRFGAEASDRFFHDYAGLLMMPVALVILILLIKLMGPSHPGVQKLKADTAASKLRGKSAVKAIG